MQSNCSQTQSPSKHLFVVHDKTQHYDSTSFVSLSPSPSGIVLKSPPTLNKLHYQNVIDKKLMNKKTRSQSSFNLPKVKDMKKKFINNENYRETPLLTAEFTSQKELNKNCLIASTTKLYENTSISSNTINSKNILSKNDCKATNLGLYTNSLPNIERQTSVPADLKKQKKFSLFEKKIVETTPPAKKHINRKALSVEKTLFENASNSKSHENVQDFDERFSFFVEKMQSSFNNSFDSQKYEPKINENIFTFETDKNDSYNVKQSQNNNTISNSSVSSSPKQLVQSNRNLNFELEQPLNRQKKNSNTFSSLHILNNKDTKSDNNEFCNDEDYY